MVIASCLVDTNILLRITRRSDPYYALVDTALAGLAGQRTSLCFTHQNIAELERYDSSNRSQWIGADHR